MPRRCGISTSPQFLSAFHPCYHSTFPKKMQNDSIDDYQTQTVASEKKRRQTLRDKFKYLSDNIPALKSSQCRSEAVILQKSKSFTTRASINADCIKAVERINMLIEQRATLRDSIRRLNVNAGNLYVLYACPTGTETDQSVVMGLSIQTRKRVMLPNNHRLLLRSKQASHNYKLQYIRHVS